MISFQEIFKSYKKCRFGKPYSRQQTFFEIALSKKLADLTEDLNSQKYKLEPYNFFIITHPKPREIFAAHFRDRVVHHYLVSKLTPIWERKFSDASFACREGKGTHEAIKTFCKNVHSISHGGTKQVYVLQLDIKQFFAAIHRPTLLNLYHKHNPYQELNWLITLIISHDARKNIRRFKTKPSVTEAIPKEKSWFSKPEEFGIPIGNLTSQFGANIYLNDCDHYVQRTLKPKSYLRYMDDLTFIDTDKIRLAALIKPVTDWLWKYRKLEIKVKKTKLTLLKNGIELLGYHIKQIGRKTTERNKNSTLMLMPKSKKWDFVKSLKKFNQHDILESEFLNPLCPRRVYLNQSGQNN